MNKLKAVWYSASLTWSDWSTWGKCETEKGCGRGIRRRSSILERERCINDKRYETRPCKLKSCPGTPETNERIDKQTLILTTVRIVKYTVLLRFYDRSKRWMVKLGFMDAVFCLVW